MRGGKAEKEKGGVAGERLSFIHPCVSCSLVWTDRRKEGGRDGGVERKRERWTREKREKA